MKSDDTQASEVQAPPQGPAFALAASENLAAFLHAQGCSLAFTTYQANKLFLVGTQDDQRLAVQERSFPRCMGLCATDRGLWMSSLHGLWYFRDLLEPGQSHGDHDAVYVPFKSHTTGDIDIHDIETGTEGRPVFVATRFNCLATLSDTDSFCPHWMPPFITDLVAQDRCHLNGMAMVDGQPTYVTLIAPSNTEGGWRDARADGGQLIEVSSGTPLVTGLSMPHSPRLHDGRIWMIESGTGAFGYVEGEQFRPITYLPGFARGLAFIDNHAVIGVSRLRRAGAFDGLELSRRLENAQEEPQTMLAIVDLSSGDIVHSLHMEGPVRELYDVAILPNVRRPLLIGLQAPEIRFMVRPGRFGTDPG